MLTFVCLLIKPVIFAHFDRIKPVTQEYPAKLSVRMDFFACDIDTMPQDGPPLSLLPGGVSIDSLELDSDSEFELSQGRKVEPNVLVSFVPDKDSQNSELPFSSQYYKSIPSSQESINDSEDTDLDLSQKSQRSEQNLTIPNEEISAIDLPIHEGMLLHRSQTPVEAILENSDDFTDLEAKLNPVTPTKPEGTAAADPWTPTANLKMLISAASPEIRNRDKLKQLECNEDSLDSDVSSLISNAQEVVVSTTQEAPKKARKKQQRKQKNKNREDLDADVPSSVASAEGQSTSSRKEKSLGLLCQRFLHLFPEFPAAPSGLEICLDAVAKDLNVERRRIYDIINVLESVEIVSRVAKNKYSWHGKTNLSHTLAKLKGLALSDGFAAQVDRIKNFECSKIESEAENENSPRKRLPLQFKDESNHQFGLSSIGVGSVNESIRKDRSLGIMSQKFLMLFLVSQPRTVNLDMAAKILIGDPTVDKTETGKFKTKIRRLYDIANILTSLNLIQKVHVTEVRGRKPAFKYVGPDIDSLDTITATRVTNKAPSSRGKSLLCKSLSFNSDRAMPSAPTKKPFARHSSFDMLSEVVAQERDRLYFESRQQTASPLLQTPTSTSNEPQIMTKTSRSPRININNTLGTYTIVKGHDQKTSTVTSETASGTINQKVVSHTNEEVVQGRKEPVSSSLTPAVVSSVSVPLAATTAGQISVSAGQQSSSVKAAGDKKPTVITISRQQLEALMGKVGGKSGLSAPVISSSESGTPGMYKVISTHQHVGRGLKRPLPTEAVSAAKRQCTVPVQSVVMTTKDKTSQDRQDAEVARINSETRKFPSPQRSLNFQDTGAVQSPGSTLSTPTLRSSQETQPNGPTLEYPAMDTPPTSLVYSPLDAHVPTGVTPRQVMGAPAKPVTMVTAPGTTPVTLNGAIPSHWTPTPTGITRNGRGIQPTAGNIINLLPFFSNSPGSEVKVMTPGVRQVKVIPQRTVTMTVPGNGQIALLPSSVVRKPVPLPSMDAPVQPQMLTPDNGSVSMEPSLTPQGQTVNPAYIGSALKTPVDGRLVLTPGTYFRSTPQVPVTQVTSITNNRSSAFQVFQTSQPGENPGITARRLTLSE